MHLFTEHQRPHAAYACPGCRQINVIEASDVGDEAMVTVNCLNCDREHRLEQGYIKRQLNRDLNL